MWLSIREWLDILDEQRPQRQPQRDMPCAEAGGKGVEDDQGRTRHSSTAVWYST